MAISKRWIEVALLLWTVRLQTYATGKRHPVPAPPPLGQAAAVAEIYAWWCMFAETSRPDSQLCKEWVHDHKTREPRQYMEGRESFHLVAETDEMYRAWCADAAQAARTVSVCQHLFDEAPIAQQHSSSASGSSNSNPQQPHSSALSAYLGAGHSELFSTKGGGVVSSEMMTHCPVVEEDGKVRVRLVMLVGVEGAGHHFLASIVYKAEGQVLYLKDWAADIFLTPSKISPRQKHPEGSARVLAQRIRKDLKLREMFRRAPFTPVRTVAFVGDSFPEPGGGSSGGLGGNSGSSSGSGSDPRDHHILHHPDLVAFTNLKYHGFDPVLLFLRRHLAMATLSSLRRFPRHDLHHELFMTETTAQVIEGYYQHLCRPTAVQSLNQTSSYSASVPSAATHARAVAAGEMAARELSDDPLDQRQRGPGAQGSATCYRVDFADLCSGRAKAYMEVAWALCIPSLDYVTVFHKCQNRAKDYPAEDLALARTFFEGARANMYPHVGYPAMLI